MPMMDPNADLEITAYRWVPDFAQGHVRDLRPRWACEEAGLPYRERLINVQDKPAGFDEEQPWSQVPVMRDGALHIWESGAILLHLGEKSGNLLPAEGQARANAISWLFSAFNTIEPLMFEFTNVTAFARGEEWAELRRPGLEDFIRTRLAPLEARLASRNWLDEDFTVADIAMVTGLRAMTGSKLLAEHEAVSAYMERGMARPGFRQAMADQLAAFTRHPDNKD